jgi:Tetratricopeptide repeat
MSNLAEVLSRQGKYEQVEHMHEQTLDLARKVLGGGSPDTLKSMNNLVTVLREQGKYQQVEWMRRQTLQMTGPVLG